MTTVLGSNEFEEKVLKADKPVLVDFFASWCGPCKALAPTIDELSNELAGEAYVYKIDTDASPDVAMRYGITSIPTIISFKDGEVHKKTTGAQSAQALKELLN